MSSWVMHVPELLNLFQNYRTKVPESTSRNGAELTVENEARPLEDAREASHGHETANQSRTELMN